MVVSTAGSPPERFLGGTGTMPQPCGVQFVLLVNTSRICKGKAVSILVTSHELCPIFPSVGVLTV